MLTIEHLADHKEHIDTVVNWIWNEFGNENDYEFFKSIIKNSLIKNKLPLTFIALEDNELVGTIGLWRSDLMSRKTFFLGCQHCLLRKISEEKGLDKNYRTF